jgi:hypothetical protein
MQYLPEKKDKVDGNVRHRERKVLIMYRKVKPKKVNPLNPDGKVAICYRNSSVLVLLLRVLFLCSSRSEVSSFLSNT